MITMVGYYRGVMLEVYLVIGGVNWPNLPSNSGNRLFNNQQLPVGTRLSVPVTKKNLKKLGFLGII